MQDVLVALAPVEEAPPGVEGMIMTKYRNKKTTVDGYVFDSRREADRYCELKLLQRAGKIGDLRRQVPFQLIPAQRDEDGKLLERSCEYIADFTYFDTAGNYIVEDAKGKMTPDYIIKRKLMMHVHGIRIREV